MDPKLELGPSLEPEPDETVVGEAVVRKAPRPVPDADLRGLAAFVLIACSGMTVEIFLVRWGLDDPGPTPLGALLAFWVLSPYLFLAAFTRRAAPSADRAALHFGGSLLIGAFGVAACYYGFYRDIGAQDGVLPLLVPLWQWIGAAAVAAGLRLLPD